MKKIILFDIDYVLIDSANLRELTREEISFQLGVSLSVIEYLYNKFESKLSSLRNFSPKKYGKFLAKRLSNTSIENEVIRVYFKNPDIYKKSVCPKVIPTLRRLKQKYCLGIFSEGVKEFQMTKLKLSGIIQYLDQKYIFIFPNKTGKAGELVIKIGEIYFVDDNPRHIKDITATTGAHPIWLKRGLKAQTEETLNCPTILNLKELEETLILPDRQ